jgi:hypothetical protein
MGYNNVSLVTFGSFNTGKMILFTIGTEPIFTFYPRISILKPIGSHIEKNVQKTTNIQKSNTNRGDFFITDEPIKKFTSHKAHEGD